MENIVNEPKLTQTLMFPLNFITWIKRVFQTIQDRCKIEKLFLKLKKFQHNFCRACWTAYLTTKIKVPELELELEFGKKRYRFCKEGSDFADSFIVQLSGRRCSSHTLSRLWGNSSLSSTVGKCFLPLKPSISFPHTILSLINLASSPV